MNLPIETERLRLRKYKDRDLADILAYSSDADFWLARNLDWSVSYAVLAAEWRAKQDRE